MLCLPYVDRDCSICGYVIVLIALDIYIPGKIDRSSFLLKLMPSLVIVLSICFCYVGLSLRPALAEETFTHKFPNGQIVRFPKSEAAYIDDSVGLHFNCNYTEALAFFGELPLGQLKRNGASKAIRLLCLRSFRVAKTWVCIAVVFDESHANRGIIRVVELEPIPYSVASLSYAHLPHSSMFFFKTVRKSESSLDKSQVQELRRSIESANLSAEETIDKETPPTGFDGFEWLMEFLDKDTCHFAVRITPDHGPVYDIGTLMISMAKL